MVTLRNVSGRRRSRTAVPRFRPALLVAAAAFSVLPAPVTAQNTSYLFYVASESEDEVSLLRFTPGRGLAVEKVIPVGFWPAEIEAPHGVTVDADGTHWYVTLGHGVPVAGSLLRYATGADTLVGHADLGLFPATVAVAPIGLALAVNANFHGEHRPSTVSVVDVEGMVELAQIETCTMPHGSRLSPDGTRHYSACMMDDRLVEIDVLGLAVERTLTLDAGTPHAHAGTSGTPTCTPTWAAPTPDGRFVYVTCNRSHEILEVALDGWAVARRWPAPGGPYNAEVTPDGRRLVVTHKAGAEVSVWDLARGTRLASVPSTRKVTHGVAVSPDGRYAFVTVEGIGGEPGAVEVLDLGRLRRVAQADVGKQAGGIAFWKTETASGTGR